MDAVRVAVRRVCGARPHELVDRVLSRVLEEIAAKLAKGEAIKDVGAYASTSARHALADLTTRRAAAAAKAIPDDASPIAAELRASTILPTDARDIDRLVADDEDPWAFRLDDVSVGDDDLDDEYDLDLTDRGSDAVRGDAAANDDELSEYAAELEAHVVVEDGQDDDGEWHLVRRGVAQDRARLFERARARIFYWQVAAIAGRELARTLVATTGRRVSRPSPTGRGTVYSTALEAAPGRCMTLDGPKARERFGLLFIVEGKPNREFRRRVVEQWTTPPAYLDVRPLDDGSPRRLDPREVTLVSLMLGAQPIRGRDLRLETTARDVYEAEHTAIKKAVQRARNAEKTSAKVNVPGCGPI